jgi:hypothetical protein
MNWLEQIQARREDYAEAQIIRPFIERCQEYSILPRSKNSYRIVWTDIFAPSEKERAQIGQIRASALQSYMNNPAAESVVPVEIFYELMQGLDKDTIARVKLIHKAALAQSAGEEAEAFVEEPEPQPVPQPTRTPSQPQPVVHESETTE